MNKVDEWTVRMGDEGPLHNKNRTGRMRILASLVVALEVVASMERALPSEVRRRHQCLPDNVTVPRVP